MTNQPTQYELAGDVEINGEVYQLVRLSPQPGQPASNLSYKADYLDEPPWADGAPNLVSDPSFTWHLGGFKSRQGIPGTSEYGQNTDGRWAFRLLPSAKINVVTLTASVANPTSIFEALGYIWVVAGRYVYRINPADDSIVQSKDFGASVLGTMGLRWETDVGLVCTNETTNSLYKVAAIGSPDTWTQTCDVEAYLLAAGINRLFKITKTGELKNIVTSLDPMTDANWADQVQVGETSTLPTSLLAYERTVFIGKPEGLFGVGDDGFGLPLIKRIAREADNCRGMTIYDPWVLVPHIRGLYRFVPGLVESCGLEKELLNESPVAGRWTALAIDGEWVYGAVGVGSNTYILAGRDRRGGEAGFGPMIWDTWLYFAATCKAAWISALTSPARFWFGHGNDIAYVKLSDFPGATEYALSGSRFSAKLRFDDWNSKDFPKIDLVGKNLSTTKYWDVYYSIDGGAYSNLDVDGAAMRVNSDGRRTFFLPTTAVGRETQFRFDYISNSSSNPPELNFIEPFAVPQSKKTPVVAFHLALEQGVRHDRSIESRTAVDQLDALETLEESPSAVATSGPWGESVNAWIKKVKVVDISQQGVYDPVLVVEVSMQLREEA